jgi:5-methylcytosine-specific restriction protein B
MHNLGKAVDELSEQERERFESSASEDRPFVRMCCFHPSFSYEDFIEGYRPQARNGSMTFELRPGIFKRLCDDAASDLQHRYYLIVDEINRGDIPRIFGELMAVLEKDKRSTAVTLPLTGTPLKVPPNVYVIATMNTADRSIALLDTALRRRFGFIELMPDTSVLGEAAVRGIPLGPWLDALNALVLQHVGRDARNLQVGHSFLMENGRPISDFGKFVKAVREEIIPLIQEYCYEDYLACEKILGKAMINAEKQQIRDDIFEPARQEDLVNALLAFCPEVSASPQAMTAEAQQAAEADEAEEDSSDEQSKA